MGRQVRETDVSWTFVRAPRVRACETRRQTSKVWKPYPEIRVWMDTSVGAFRTLRTPLNQSARRAGGTMPLWSACVGSALGVTHFEPIWDTAPCLNWEYRGSPLEYQPSMLRWLPEPVG